MTRRTLTTLVEQNGASSAAEVNGRPSLSLSIRVITHNIRYATKSPFKGEELWPVRCPRLCSELVFNSENPATFICLQEVLDEQLVDILGCLNHSAAPKNEWACIGVGRDDGKKAGEYSPIFYRPSIWKLHHWKTIWLSDTPTVPSKGWDASSIRIVTVGDFVHTITNQKVTVLSTHLDDQGSRSRENSARMILKEVQSLAATTKPSVVLLGGDFNSPPNDGAYQIMTSPKSSMEDISAKIPKDKRYGNEMTFTSFGHVDNEPSRIDFIFSRKGDKLTHRAYGVLPNRFDDGVYISDHRACVADLLLDQ